MSIETDCCVINNKLLKNVAHTSAIEHMANAYLGYHSFKVSIQWNRWKVILIECLCIQAPDDQPSAGP